jgi:hypothetical protein
LCHLVKVYLVSAISLTCLIHVYFCSYACIVYYWKMGASCSICHSYLNSLSNKTVTISGNLERLLKHTLLCRFLICVYNLTNSYDRRKRKKN